MNHEKRIAYINADLRSVGPTKQTLNIICNTDFKKQSIVITLFDEPEQTLLKEYEKQGITVIPLHLSRTFFLVSGRKKLCDVLLKNRITLVHSNGVKPDILTYSVCKKISLPHVVTLRNFPMEDLPVRMNPILGYIAALAYLYVLKKCKYLIACSKSIAQKMQDHYKLLGITAIQNGVDTHLFFPVSNEIKQKLREELNIPIHNFLFISTGSFILRKHNENIIKAFIAIKRDNINLILIGDGSLLDQLRIRYKTVLNVHFLGEKNKIVKYLQCADVFISASDSEGLPNAVLEAMACNLPVILSDIPQHKEILEALPECGTIFPLHNIENLALKMQEHINIKQVNINIASKLLESPFTMKEMGKRYKIYYKRIGLQC